MDSNLDPSAYQPNNLPLGRSSSAHKGGGGGGVGGVELASLIEGLKLLAFKSEMGRGS